MSNNESQAVKAQQQMHKIQNKRSISFAGAYLKYGFHEDGFTSGLLAACSVEDKGLYDRIHQQFSSSSLGSKASRIIQTKNSTVRPPFAIEHADHHLFFRQSMMNVAVAGVFRIFEASGLRLLIGALGSVVLRLCGVLVGWPISVVVGVIGWRGVYGKEKVL